MIMPLGRSGLPVALALACWLVLLLGTRPACGGCCQEGAEVSSAVTYNMATCRLQEYEYILETRNDPAADPYSGEAVCQSKNIGCCALGPPGACNWRRDCCNMGTGGFDGHECINNFALA